MSPKRQESRVVWLEGKRQEYACSHLLAELTLAWALSSFVPLIGVFVAFQLEWLPCGVILLSSGLGARMRFVQGTGQQSPPTAFPPFLSVAPKCVFV
jgi:hypothetical protein